MVLTGRDDDPVFRFARELGGNVRESSEITQEDGSVYVHAPGDLDGVAGVVEAAEALSVCGLV